MITKRPYLLVNREFTRIEENMIDRLVFTSMHTATVLLIQHLISPEIAQGRIGNIT